MWYDESSIQTRTLENRPSMTHAQIQLSFIDDETDEVFASTQMPVDRLPESFAIDTVLHLGEAQWSVVHAEPAERSTWVSTGELALRLRRMTQVNPQDILFSVPTLCDALPPLTDGALQGDELTLHEDDWRQVELLPRTLPIHEDFSQIQAILTASEGAGFRQIHIRRHEPALTMSLELLESALGASVSKGVTFRGALAPILDGFSAERDGVTIYGRAPGGVVCTCGVYTQGMISLVDMPWLRTLLSQVDAQLVDWCRGEVLS